jgi:hypothetical protein
MANTYTLIEGKTLASNTANITFSSIPQTYTDLIVLISPRFSNALSMPGFSIYLNGVTTNQSGKYLLGNGTSAVSSSSILLDSTGGNDTTSTFASLQIYFPNYTSANYKSFSIDGVAESNVTATEVYLSAGLWSSTSAITSIGFERASASFATYSTFYLYGINNS